MDLLVANNAAFHSYIVMCLVLVANLLGVWLYSGAARRKTGGALNEEDAAFFKASVTDEDPPEVRRVLRAHANAVASIYPFLLLSFLYIVLGGHAPVTEILFGVFTFARLGHTVVYVAGKQPWRTVFFTIGLVDTVVLMGFIVKSLF